MDEGDSESLVAQPASQIEIPEQAASNVRRDGIQ